MPEITDPALLGLLEPVNADPIIKRASPRLDAQMQGDVLSNQQKQQSLSQGPLDAEKKRLDIEEKRRKLESGDAGAATAAERDSAAFLRRAIGANDIYDSLDIGPRTYVGDIVQGTAPGLLNQLPGAIGNSPERQQADAAELEFVSAILRADSGAAIPEAEIESAKDLYFPLPGEGEDVIAQKKEARQRAISGLQTSAGRLADEVLGDIVPSTEVVEEVAPETTAPDEKQRAFSALFRANPEISPEQLNAFSEEMFGASVPNAEEIVQSYRDTGGLGAVGELQPAEPGLGDSFLGGVGDLVEGAGETLGLVANPVNYGINEIFGTNLSTNLGETAREASGLPDNPNPVASAINKGGVGALSFAGAARPAANVATGAAQNAFQRFAAAPAVDTIGGAGAGGASAMVSDENPIGQAAVGILGGIGASSLAQTGRNIGTRFTGQPNPLAQAANRIDVDLMPAQAGGPGIRASTAGARQGIVSEIPIARGVDAQARQTEGVRNSASRSIGDALDKEDAGELVRTAANVYSKSTGTTGGKLYTRAFDMAGDTKAPLPKAIETIDENLAEIAQSPGGSDSALYKSLEDLKGKMAGDEFTILGIRNMRTQLREEADFNGLRGSRVNSIYGDIVDAASEDVAAGLTASGNERAAQAFRTADDFWKTRVETIDDVLDPVLGKNSPKSGTQILGALERMANRESGDATKLRRLMRAMPAEEAANVRATVINRLGRPTAGQETDSAFSLGKFLTDYNKMSDKAKTIMFPGKSKQALDDLATVAKADKQAGRLLNTSNSARAVGVQAGVSGLAGWLISPLAAASIGGAQFGMGKLLASPRFANWLAKAPKSDQNASRYIDRLSAIATREPALAADARALQTYLKDSISASPGRAAAEEESNSGRIPPR